MTNFEGWLGKPGMTRSLNLEASLYAAYYLFIPLGAALI
jgi:hypothetical protein